MNYYLNNPELTPGDIGMDREIAVYESKEEMWDKLIELGVSEQTLQIVTSINGYTEQTMLDALYAHTGYRNFEQMEDGE